MSVDAINGANAQQQPQKHSALPGAIASGVGLGVVGAGAGYFLGGKRPTLEQVFEQTPDTFTKKEVTEKDAEAAKKLQDAVHEVDTSTKAENARKALEEKEVEIDGKKFKQAEVKQELLEARKAVNSAKTDEEKKAAKDLLEKAEKKVQAFEKIKDALPKEGKGRMAMIAGGIAAAVGLIGGYLMNSGHSDKA